MNLTQNDLGSAIKRAAKSVSYQWPGVIEADDLEHEIHLHILESPGTQRDLDEMDEVSQYRTLSKIGHRLASQERIDYDYYKGSYKYSVKEVKDLLADGAITEQQERFSSSVVDLRESMLDLPDQYHDAIVERYVELTPTAGDKQYEDALRRGIESLVDGMNKLHKRKYSERLDGPGTRDQADTSDEYEGEVFDFSAWANNQGLGWG